MNNQRLIGNNPHRDEGTPVNVITAANGAVEAMITGSTGVTAAVWAFPQVRTKLHQPFAKPRIL